MKKYFIKLFDKTFALNEKHIKNFALKYGKKGKWLDLGCDDGSWTVRITNKKVDWHGIEVVDKRARLARKNGIKTKAASLEKRLPYKDNQFDLVHSNQVIEHLFDLDIFLSEIHRVLKPKGILLISTENPASWHNIFALLMGWQMFSATNISIKKLGVGNPLAIHAGKTFEETAEGRTPAWEHNKLLTPRALCDMLETHGFKILDKLGAGYHPLPHWIGKLDINHSHFYVIAARKSL